MPILVDNEFWSTVAFSSRTIRPEAIEPSAMRILAAGATEIAAAHYVAIPAMMNGAQVDLGAAHNLEPEDEPLPGCVIPLPLPTTRPQIPAAYV